MAVELNEEQLATARLCAKHKEMQIKIKELEEELKEVDEQIKAVMTEKEVDTLSLGIFKVTWKDISSTKLDSKKLKEELPDVYERFIVD